MTRRNLVRTFLGAVALAAALISPSRAERLPVKLYTSADGLGSSFIDYAMRDSRGFLWFCTRDGLSRFDGSRFVTYQIGEKDSPPGIESIAETSGGVYWVSTTGGTFRFRADAVARVPTGGNTRPILPTEFITEGRGSVFQDRQGRIWFGAGGIYLLSEENGKVKINATPQDAVVRIPGFGVTAFFQGADDSIWCNTTGGVVRLLPDGRVILYHVEVVNRSNMAMLLDADGRIWFSTGLNAIVFMPETIASLAGAGNLIERDLIHLPITQALASTPIALPQKPGETIRFSGGDLLNVHATRKLYQTSDRHVWLTTERELLEYDGTMFHRYTTGQGLLPSMSRMVEDIAGNLWISGQTGLVKLDRRNLHSFNEVDGLNSINVQAITEDVDGTLYFGNGDFYLSRLASETFQTERPALPASALSVWTSRYAMLDREGNWWILTKEKLYRFKKGNLRQPTRVYSVADGLRSEQIFQIFEDREGNIWVSQQPIDSVEGRGLSVLWRGETRFHTFGDAEGYPPGHSASSFVEDGSGHLWLGFYEGGMARFDGTRFTVFDEKSGVPKGLITDLLIDEKGRMWLTSSNGGVSRIDDLSTSQPQFFNLNTSNGLSSNNVRTIVEDKLNNIYIGTVRGVDRIAADGAKIKHYSVSDGLAGDFVVDSHCDRNGVVWFATTAGLSRLLPTAEEPRHAPPIWLGGLEVSGVRQPVYEMGQTSIGLLDLNYRQNTLQIEFFSLDFRSGEEVRYQYMLDEVDKDWSAPTDQRTVTLANLQAGTYRFLVRAITSDGVVSKAPAEIRFRISPPIWSRWWFRALVVLVIVAAVVVFYRYRIARLREVNSALQAANVAAENLRKAKEERLAELERVRYRIATDLHDDIGASLTQIAILSEVAQQQNARGNGAVAEPLDMIYNVSNELVGTMSDIVWAINPRKDHLFDLTQRMRRFASDVLSAKEMDFEFIAPPKTEGLVVGANVRREVFLIFKEAVNNIVKHSRATVVEIRFEVSGDNLRLQLKDNGVGFAPPAPGTVSSADLFSDQRGGNGLISMRRRAADLGGEYSLESVPGGGTSITLNLPANLATEAELVPEATAPIHSDSDASEVTA